MNREYVEKLEVMSDVQLAREWQFARMEFRRVARSDGDMKAFRLYKDKASTLSNVIVDRFVERAYRESRLGLSDE